MKPHESITRSLQPPNSFWGECGFCNGFGEVEQIIDMDSEAGLGVEMIVVRCPHCNGDGGFWIPNKAAA